MLSLNLKNVRYDKISYYPKMSKNAILLISSSIFNASGGNGMQIKAKIIIN